MMFTVISIVYLSFVSCSVDEFYVHGPDALNKLAMDEYFAARKRDPVANDKLDSDSPIMKAARQHAVNRFATKSDEELSLITQNNDPNKGFLELPSPEGRDSHLASAVTTQGVSSEVMLPGQASALAIAFNEDVGLGAIARAGAFPIGEDGAWAKFAEDKMKRDAQMNHQELLWELGSAVMEAKQVAQGGMNLTMENDLLDNMKEWFEKGGGAMRYAKAVAEPTTGFQLQASEEIQSNEAILSVPVKLTMCRITARNVLISNRGKYLGAELKSTFEKNEVWGLAIFLLHEYYKEVNGDGSKWGPYIRSLRVRFLTTPSLQGLRGTTAAELSKHWIKSADKLAQFSTGHEGPCNPTTYICRTKPKDRMGENRFNQHQIRWAYWVVKQNAIRIRHATTGNTFLALVPYYNMVEKRLNGGGSIAFEVDGNVAVRVGTEFEETQPISIHPGDFTDAEFFMRYMTVPEQINYNNAIKLSLPGTLPKDSQLLTCLKNPKEARKSDKCKGGEYRSNSVFWQSETLAKWRKEMNLPPRLGELMNAANRLHLFGDDKEETNRISAANAMNAGLPVSSDMMAPEEQLMLLGLAQDNDAASMMLSTQDRTPPQLYTAPDPEEDPEAQRAMENLASLALQIHSVISSGNIILNATKAVLNHTKEFFQHGIVPQSGLDELDDFLLKKIGMVLHCGASDDMQIRHGNVTEELFCAMRVHLMNETEVHTFCPADARIWNDNCQDVEFMNYTAISENNELAVIEAFRASISGLLHSYPSTADDDKEMLKKHFAALGADEIDIDLDADTQSKPSSDSEEEEGDELSDIMLGVVQLRLREKQLLNSALDYLSQHEVLVKNGSIPFQLELKIKEREESDAREAEQRAFVEEVKTQAAHKPDLAVLDVDMGEGVPKQNLTLQEGDDIKSTVVSFCRAHGVGQENVVMLENALRARVPFPAPLNLLLGVVTPLGHRRILGIRDGFNASLETAVFCARNNITVRQECEDLKDRVDARLDVSDHFNRKVHLVIPVDAPDSRKLQLIVREGEQHDVGQLVSDFFEYYHMNLQSVPMMTNEVLKRLSEPVLQIPVGLSAQRKVVARFTLADNITAVVEGFANVFEVDEGVKLQLTKLARAGMAPGTYVV